MIEHQRLAMERDVTTARRAIHRALTTAESGAYYGIEDALHVIQAALAEVTDTVMRGGEHPRLHASISAYLYTLPHDDHSPAPSQPLPSRPHHR